jgi:hypothetical protein
MAHHSAKKNELAQNTCASSIQILDPCRWHPYPLSIKLAAFRRAKRNKLSVQSASENTPQATGQCGTKEKHKKGGFAKT